MSIVEKVVIGISITTRSGGKVIMVVSDNLQPLRDVEAGVPDTSDQMAIAVGKILASGKFNILEG